MVLEASRGGRTVVIATHRDVHAGLDPRVVDMADGRIVGTE
jgi:ABC-type lipoprotein export system ATPase subunit